MKPESKVIPVYAVKARGGVKVQLRVFFTSALYGTNGQHNDAATLCPRMAHSKWG
jgi:hypothetical protein